MSLKTCIYDVPPGDWRNTKLLDARRVEGKAEEISLIHLAKLTKLWRGNLFGNIDVAES
jgi:hypothetical protein